MSGRTGRLRFDIREASGRLLLVYGVVLLLNLAFYMVLTRPKTVQLAAMRSQALPQIEALKARQEQVEAKEAYLEALLKAQEDLDYLRNEVLSTRRKRMIEVELEVARLSREFNVSFQQVRFENEDLPDEGLERMAMVVPLEGGYQNLRKFIRAVENSDKFLVIEQVALGTGAEGGVMLQLNITLATYFELPEDRRPQAPARRRRARA